MIRVLLATLVAALLGLPIAAATCPSGGSQPRALLAGDSWAAFLWTDDSYDPLFDHFGHGDKTMISRAADNQDPGYDGPEYAISGSEAREWANREDFPWISNVVADLGANPGIDLVVLSIGGNDVLAGRTGDGWYKDMDLDVPGSEAALFQRVEDDTRVIIDALQAVRPDLEVLLSSYEYPNLNVSFLWCWAFACPLRDRLSRDPVGDEISDAEINALAIDVEARRIGWADADPRLSFDNALGLMHAIYGDGVAAPGTLPRPGMTPPDYSPFPGGNPALPTLRQNFRPFLGADADPIHLSAAAYRDKIRHQIEGFFLPRFRGRPDLTVASEGQGRDGWSNGASAGADAVRVGDDASGPVAGIVSFDLAGRPPGQRLAAASLYLQRHAERGTNPFASGALGMPILDLVAGSFGTPQVEAGDATAPADAEDVGCFHGRVIDDGAALRIDLTADALAILETADRVQMRLRFPSIDGGEDAVDFATGDDTLGPAREWRRVVLPRADAEGRITLVEHTLELPRQRSLGDVLGTPAPSLDLFFESTDGLPFADGFESGSLDAWSASSP